MKYRLLLLILIGGILCYGKAEIPEGVDGAGNARQVQEVSQSKGSIDTGSDSRMGYRAALQPFSAGQGTRASKDSYKKAYAETSRFRKTAVVADTITIPYDHLIRGVGGVLDRVSTTFIVTAYSPYEESTGKYPGHPDYKKTATGKVAVEGWTIAADFDVLPPGSIVWIEDIGFRRVDDCGGAIEGNKIDVYMEDISRCLEFGRQERNVTIFRRGKNEH